MITKYKAEVAEVVPGSEAQFSDDGSGSLFYESFDVDYTPEVQAIILESSADDMGGFFVVNFMGESTPNIYIDAEADDIKEEKKPVLRKSRNSYQCVLRWHCVAQSSVSSSVGIPKNSYQVGPSLHGRAVSFEG